MIYPTRSSVSTAESVRPAAPQTLGLKSGGTPPPEPRETCPACGPASTPREFATFEDYCQERWNLQRRRAYQMIEASSVVQKIAHEALPNEAQARELSKVKGDPDQLTEVWSEVIEVSDGKPTAKMVQEVVSRYIGAVRRAKRQKNRPTPAGTEAVGKCGSGVDGGLLGTRHYKKTRSGCYY